MQRQVILQRRDHQVADASHDLGAQVLDGAEPAAVEQLLPRLNTHPLPQLRGLPALTDPLLQLLTKLRNVESLARLERLATGRAGGGAPS